MDQNWTKSLPEIENWTKTRIKLILNYIWTKTGHNLSYNWDKIWTKIWTKLDEIWTKTRLNLDYEIKVGPK